MPSEHENGLKSSRSPEPAPVLVQVSHLGSNQIPTLARSLPSLHLSVWLPTGGCFAASAPKERGATRITLLATRRSERRGEKEECGVAEENIDFRGSRPGEKRIANEDKQLRSEWAIAIAEMGAREHVTWSGREQNKG